VTDLRELWWHTVPLLPATTCAPTPWLHLLALAVGAAVCALLVVEVWGRVMEREP
jgi:hypothetical protein